MTIAASNIRSVVNDDGAVLLDVDHDLILTLNSTGGYIWSRLQQGESIDAITRALARDTCTDLAVVERDIRDFLDLLKASKLLRNGDEVLP